MEIQKPKRAPKPPHKSQDYDGWLDWWTTEIKERLSDGQTLSEIQKELGIDPKRFIN